ncbi:hypothetical protein GCM10017655_11820 [Pseudomonas turukhanskensis]|uniref:Uncharacterized protein n=1 Tax=Pseudomonas turukhanskensis TaxID=1806536 RepID=A0A9W6NEV2_9PSED|nr:hypothetical protein GCM10017655_11820 [Pseudomonas turukhanskensis]
MALQPGPWSDDAAREPEAQRRAQVGARFFGFFFIDWKKKLARKARNKTFTTRGNAEKQQSPHKPQGARSTPYKGLARKARNKTFSACGKAESTQSPDKPQRCAEHTLQKLSA